MRNFFFHLVFTVLFFLAIPVFSQSSGILPYAWSATELADHTVRLTVTLPEHAHAAADQFGPKDIAPITAPQTKLLYSELTGKEESTYTAGTHVWILPPQTASSVLVAWQVCFDEICYMPDEAEIPIVRTGNAADSADIGTKSETPVTDETQKSPYALDLPRYELLRSADGYLSAKDFAAFLRGTSGTSGASIFEGHGFAVMLLLAILGGVALNLTPCVLPLLPVNLAMIGAGATSSESRSSKIKRGIAYGLGIAITYGALGVISVLLGTTFGSMDSSWIFNACIAIVFFLLALAMFEVFSIDFSRIGEKLPMPENSRLIGIALMGALSAVVAGACVAPVLVAALLQAAKMVAHGSYSGLLLPFALGIGMALPWPIAAAGISCLPTPGRWMVRVKQGLGVLILGLAVYYGYLAFDLFRSAPEMDSVAETSAAKSADMASELRSVLTESQISGRAVLLDFTAVWCKNCKAMELSVFPNPEVESLMKDFLILQIHADTPSEPETAAVLREFQVKGLPAFRLIRALSSESDSASPRKTTE